MSGLGRLGPKLGPKSTPGGFSQGDAHLPRLPNAMAAFHEVAVETQRAREARPRMQSCPRCGHVYKMPGLAGPDGTCLNGKACDRHIKRGY